MFVRRCKTSFFCPFKGLVLLLLLFFYQFSGFAIDRSKKSIKTIKHYIKIDAVDPWADADIPPHPPVTTDRSMGPYNPQIPVK